MTNRRELVQIGLIAAALPFGAASARALAPDPRGPRAVELYKVVYDTRFAASVAFAQRAAARGLAVAATEGDVTRLWYDDLYHRWQRGAAAIAGLTAGGALFCLEQLARDQRMRVVFRAEHSPPVAGCVRHDLDGPAVLVDEAARGAGESNWAAAMADSVRCCPSGREGRASARVTTAVPSVLTPAAEPLFSWVIAPLAGGVRVDG